MQVARTVSTIQAGSHDNLKLSAASYPLQTAQVPALFCRRSERSRGASRTDGAPTVLERNMGRETMGHPPVLPITVALELCRVLETH